MRITETLLEYKCPCCGGGIHFDSGVQRMKCPYCETEFDMQTLAAQREQLEQEPPEDMTWQNTPDSEWMPDERAEMRAYICQSCGGEIAVSRTTGATRCPYCDNPVVVTGVFSGHLRPDLVIPFRLDKEAAKDALRKHFRGKRLLPKVFKDENHIDEIQGVYVPFWLFSADADANIRYRATRIRHWSDSRYDYTETQHFSVYRAGALRFEQVPADGSSRMPDELMESLEPFNTKDAVAFQPAYLAGYLAEKYDVASGQCIGRVNERIKRSTEDAFARTVQGYATVLPENSAVRLSNGQTRYALYPVWLLNTSWRGKKYTFAMNGQTGKFVGNLPVNMGAFWAWFGGVSAAATAVIYALMWLLR